MTLFVLDIGNVILLADHQRTFEALDKYGIDREKSQQFYKIPEYLEFSRGNIPNLKFYEVIRRLLGKNLSYTQVKEAHDYHLYGVDYKVLEVAGRISKNQLVFFTDTNLWQTQKERQLVDLTSLSTNIYRSHDTKKLKRDPGTFHWMTERLGVKPSKIHFIDDKKEYVLAAKDAGWNAYHFVGLEGLLKYMESIM